MSLTDRMLQPEAPFSKIKHGSLALGEEYETLQQSRAGGDQAVFEGLSFDFESAMASHCILTWLHPVRFTR